MDARTIWKRALLGLLAYLGLLACWPIVRFVYAPTFRTAAEFVVGVVDPLPGEVLVRFEPGQGGVLSVDVPHMDTVVRLHHQEFSGGDTTFGASSFSNAYHPSAFLLALFWAATPLAWRAQRARLLWALFLLHAFLALRCTLGVFDAYATSTIEGRPTTGLSPAGMRALYWIWHFVWEEPLANYLVPLAIWAVLVFPPRSGGPSRARRA